MKTVAIGLALLVLCACPAAVRAAAEDRAAVIAFELRWAHASAADIGAILAPDFADTNVNGELRTRAQIVGAPRRSPPAQFSVRYEFGPIVFLRDAVIVHGRSIAFYRGIRRYSVRFTDVLRRTSNGYQAVSAQETLEERHARPF